MSPHREDTENFAREAARAMTGARSAAPGPRLPARRTPRQGRRPRTPAHPALEIGPDASRSQLHDAVADWVQTETGSAPQIRDGSRIAGGSPIYVDGKPYGVLRPEPKQIAWQQWPGLEDLVLFAATRDERNRIAVTAPNGVRIVVLGRPGGT